MCFCNFGLGEKAAKGRKLDSKVYWPVIAIL
jgi:hypothetical protein